MNITNKEAAQEVIQDCVALARIEGLEGHARAAEARLLDVNRAKRARKEEGDDAL